MGQVSHVEIMADVGKLTSYIGSMKFTLALLNERVLVKSWKFLRLDYTLNYESTDRR